MNQTHPTPEEIVDYLHGELPPAADAADCGTPSRMRRVSRGSRQRGLAHGAAACPRESRGTRAAAKRRCEDLGGRCASVDLALASGSARHFVPRSPCPVAIAIAAFLYFSLQNRARTGSRRNDRCRLLRELLCCAECGDAALAGRTRTAGPSLAMSSALGSLASSRPRFWPPAAMRAAADSPRELPMPLLEAVLSAPARISYTGVVESVRIGSHGSQASTYRIEHRAPDLTRRSYSAPPALLGTSEIVKRNVTYRIDAKRRRIVETATSEFGEGQGLSNDACADSRELSRGARRQHDVRRPSHDRRASGEPAHASRDDVRAHRLPDKDRARQARVRR